MSCVIKLLPRLGVGELRFGDDATRAREIFGEPTSIRIHPAQSGKRSSYCYDSSGLTLGFDLNGRLDFIAALGSGFELWGEDPFRVANESPNPASAVRLWLERVGLDLVDASDGLGAALTVRTENVTFCFSSEGPEALEGVQLCSPATTR